MQPQDIVRVKNIYTLSGRNRSIGVKVRKFVILKLVGSVTGMNALDPKWIEVGESVFLFLSSQVKEYILMEPTKISHFDAFSFQIPKGFIIVLN